MLIHTVYILYMLIYTYISHIIQYLAHTNLTYAIHIYTIKYIRYNLLYLTYTIYDTIHILS